MMFQRSLLLVTLTALVLQVPAFAGPDGASYERMTPSGLERLNLSAEQQSKIETIVKDSMERNSPLMEEFKAAHEATEVQILAVLTDTQRQQYEKMRTEKKAMYQMHKDKMSKDKMSTDKMMPTKMPMDTP